jgi:hypothetical protein
MDFLVSARLIKALKIAFERPDMRNQFSAQLAAHIRAGSEVFQVELKDVVDKLSFTLLMTDNVINPDDIATTLRSFVFRFETALGTRESIDMIAKGERVPVHLVSSKFHFLYFMLKFLLEGKITYNILRPLQERFHSSFSHTTDIVDEDTKEVFPSFNHIYQGRFTRTMSLTCSAACGQWRPGHLGCSGRCS